MDESGYIGLLKGQKSFSLINSGGRYNEELGTKDWGFVTSQNSLLLGFMGFEPHIVIAQGLLAKIELKENLEITKQQASEIITKWYK